MPDGVHMRVDLWVDAESISGSAGEPQGETTSFDGWLGLISIVEHVQSDLGERTGTAREFPQSAPEHEHGPADTAPGEDRSA